MSDTTGLLPFPADGHTARWATWDGEHEELLTLRWDNEAWTASGAVGRERVEYVLRISPMWRVRQLLLFRDLDEPDLWLGTDGQGRWGEVNGARRPELDGAADVALACTPFTMAIPIRRLALEVGEHATLVVLDVDVETLGVAASGVTFTRVGRRRWRVDAESGLLELDVDDHGLPLDVPGRFRRVG